MGGQESKKEKVFQTHLRSWPHVPPGGDGDAHEGFVAQQLPVELLEVPELPFHVPYELPMGQLDGVHIEAWDLCRRTTQISPPAATRRALVVF